MSFDREVADSVFAVTAQGTNAGATATKTASGTKTYYVTHISGVSDAATTLQVLGGTNGTTVQWEVKVQVNVPFGFSFVEPIPGVSGQAVSAKLAASTAYCSANVGGFSI